MTFSAPIAFFLGLLALPIVVFYILKVRLRRVPVSTNLFWKQIYEEKPPRSIWQYFRHFMSLLLQLVLLALLMFAVTNPLFFWQKKQARRMVVVIDNSASMQANDIAPTRFDEAIRSAKRLVDGLRFDDEMAIVLAGPKPEVVIGMSNHPPTLKRTLEELKVSDNPSELVPAIELGKKLIGNHPQGQIVVFSDGCSNDAKLILESSTPLKEADLENNKNETKPEFTEVQIELVGRKSANVGITQFQVRRSMVDPRGYEILAEIKNASDSAVQCRLEIELAGSPVDIFPLKLDANETWSKSMEKTSLEGGVLVASITQISEPENKSKSSISNESGTDHSIESPVTLNALAVDDRAWAFLPSREIQRVLIVSPGNLFLRKVFEANPLVQLTVVKELPEEWPKDSLIVLHKKIPKQFPKGNVFVIDPETSNEHWELGKNLENPIVTDLDKTSPLMNNVRLDNVLMPESKRLNFKSKPHVLAGSISGDPIFVEVISPTGKILVLSVNIEEGDLAFRTAFPILITNSLSYFAGNSGELSQSDSTGAIASLELDKREISKQSNWILKSPSGKTIDLTKRIQTHLPSDKVNDKPEPFQENEANASTSATSGQGVLGSSEKSGTPTGTEPIQRSTVNSIELVCGPFNECGIWSVLPMISAENDPHVPNREMVEGLPLMLHAVNLASSDETDIRPDDALLETIPSVSAVSGILSRPFWFYLTVAACMLSVSEWFLYQRRFIS